MVAAMESALLEPAVKNFLICQPAHLKGAPVAPFPKRARGDAGGAPAAPETGDPSDAKDARKVRKKAGKAKAKARNAALADEVQRLRSQVGKGGGKNGKAHQSGGAPPPPALMSERRGKVPVALLPKGVAKNAEGTPFCFGFNLGTCSCKDVLPGQRCPKGLHLCCFEGCGGSHPLKGNH